jgi:hypothetical protein
MLTEWIVYAVTMLILGGGLAYTIWEFQKPEKRPSKVALGKRRQAPRRDV